MLRIMKFGGTSVGSAGAIDQTVGILARQRADGDSLVAVVSALSGVTNLLLESAAAAASGRRDAAGALRDGLRARHGEVIEELIREPERRACVQATIDDLIERCGRLIESVHVLRDLSPRSSDLIVSFGERMSSAVVAKVLEERGIAATNVDSDQVIVTDDQFGSASPLLDQTRERAAEILVPLLDAGVLPIVTGFFGASESGATTTLGRGGSDFSASILGNALDADEIWIWTDVDGVMTADPRLVPDARTLPAISFSEATELAYFGAKVIHSRTMQPAAVESIPIWIKNTFNPDHPGTRIGPEPAENGAVKAITAIPNVSVITVEGSGFLGVASVTARVFGAIGRAGINVFMISQASSQHSLSFVVPKADGDRAIRELESELELELHRGTVLSIFENSGLAAVAVVGAGMRGTPGVAGGVFSTLGNERINIVTIAQGSSELNISCVISMADLSRAVPALHRSFNLGK
jgi:aspartokinase/homoserine dehydrogenase 1